MVKHKVDIDSVGQKLSPSPTLVTGEVSETVKTGLWVGDCFIYTNSVNRLNYYVGGEIVTVAHLDRTMYLLGYIPQDRVATKIFEGFGEALFLEFIMGREPVSIVHYTRPGTCINFPLH